ncbi:DUF2798 domain-containing protein [Marinomonas mediterranea]|jgi:Protein of unknown function (DUF2798).|uniref:DUF2798 domain-containing protein n=1 Tax=Marinomonas mediterranea (strain ATCC 700492 / JCM 21426 / NBRC 103028 / MMB-1) TaxID=717774 RepID=F2JVC8_MARM1|nr:DUF2798 domain-containing protein [Marinomonas mediterranea]ADZ89386.1 hypothetical protein Marme_0080 [Marinomonas mediterranea MMB-1]WCN07485.1 DUF2798 domain-containing protein [Marinomonas mediterranea]WCN15648.1 DUF2798 domain-containing protein [Marinomonas mediterranea MMB-1]
MKLRIIFAVLMSFTLSLVMSGWVTFLNIGAQSYFFGAWIHAWILAWPAAFIIVFVSGPIVQKLSKKVADSF